MKHVALLASAATFIASSAFAVDLSQRKVAPVAPVAPTFTWTGFYAGVNAGGTWADRTNKPSLVWTSSDPLPTPDFLSVTTPPSFGSSVAGFIGGVQLGYNYQINQFVAGAEVDFIGAAMSGTASITQSYISPTALLPTTNISTSKIEQNWLSTLRARAGYSVDRFLMYVTAGLAVGNVKTINSVENSTPDIPYVGYWQGSKNQVLVGYTVGAGVEYALTNQWILRAEYLYYNLGDAKSYAYPTSESYYGVVGRNALPLVGVGKTTIDGNVIRAAVSYKF